MSHRVGVFWDYENCKPPSGLTGSFIAAKIRQAVQPLGPTTVFKAYMDTSLERKWEFNNSMPSELQSSGISLIHCPHNGGKEVADKMLIVDILLFALEHPSPALTTPSTIVLIAGDRDYSYVISTLRLRGHDVVLIFPPGNTNRKLKHLASVVLDWRADIVECLNPEQRVKSLIAKTESPYLPSPASSTHSRELGASRRPSVNSLDQYQASLIAKSRQASSRDSISLASLSNPNSSPSPSFSVLDSDSEQSTPYEVGSEDSESFVCVDGGDEKPTVPSATLADVPSSTSQGNSRANEGEVKPFEVIDDRSLRSSVTDLFSSFFRRRQQPSGVPMPSVRSGVPMPSVQSGVPTPSAVQLAAPSHADSNVAKCPSYEGSTRSGLQSAKRLSNIESVTDASKDDRASIVSQRLLFPGYMSDNESDSEITGSSSRSSTQSRFPGISELQNATFPGVGHAAQARTTAGAVDGATTSASQLNTFPSSIQSISPAQSAHTSFGCRSYAPPLQAPVFAAPVTAPTAPNPKPPSSTPNPKPKPKPKPIPPPPSAKGKSKSPTPTPPPTPPTVVDVRFTLLVTVLREFRASGNPYPAWSLVGTELLKRDEKVYKKAGAGNKLSKFLELAKSNGIVELGNVGKNSAWVRLNVP